MKQLPREIWRIILDYKTDRAIYERFKKMDGGVVVIKTPYYYRRYGGMYKQKTKEYFTISFSGRGITKYKTMKLLFELFKQARRLGIYINFDQESHYRGERGSVNSLLHSTIVGKKRGTPEDYKNLAIKLLSDGQYTFYKDLYSGSCKIDAERLRGFNATRINTDHKYLPFPAGRIGCIVKLEEIEMDLPTFMRMTQ